jgi:hypothetical protein
VVRQIALAYQAKSLISPYNWTYERSQISATEKFAAVISLPISIIFAKGVEQVLQEMAS